MYTVVYAIIRQLEYEVLEVHERREIARAKNELLRQLLQDEIDAQLAELEKEEKQGQTHTEKAKNEQIVKDATRKE